MTQPVSVLHESADATHAWIEAALGRPVRSFTRSTPPDSNWGSHARLEVWLADERSPLRLHLKIGSAKTFGRAEVDYYTRAFVGLKDAPLVRCHHAAADETHYNLLLDDHSQTHGDQKVVEPTLAYGRALVEAAAKLHAHHWPQPPPGVAEADRMVCRARAGQGAMLAGMKEGFTAAEQAIAARLIERNPLARDARLADPEGFTWTHGDLNPTNILAPFDGDRPIYLLDHQPFASSGSPPWLGIRDLAYAIVVWWPIDLRRRWERVLVEHWHSVLVSRGVANYSIEKAWSDWRLCGVQEINVPADWCSTPEGMSDMRGLWEAQLRRVLAFAEDHG
ncbi:MAG: hypothetical protein ACOYN0_07205 [Phycisphaerales bacterium]